MADAFQKEFLSFPPEEAALRVGRIGLSGDRRRAEILTQAYRDHHNVDLNAVAPREALPPVEPQRQKSSAERAGGSNDPAPAPAGSGGGAALIILGLLLIAAGFFLPAGVDVGDYSVNNIGRLNTKLMLVIAGAGFLISGSVFTASKR